MNDTRIQSVLPLALAMSGCMLVVGALPAVAQDPNRQEDLPVRERQRPELDPVGLRQGNVFFYPSIGVAEAYVSNVFATEKDEKDDFVTYVTPALNVESMGTRGGWNAAVKADLGLYASETDENFADASASAGAHYDVIADGTVDGSIGYARLHEDRSSPDDIGGSEPTVYYQGDAKLGYTHRFNRLSAGVGVAARQFSYNDTDAVGGSIDNSDRDRLETEETLRLGYDVSPDIEVFGRGALIQWNYKDDADRNGIDRSANGYRVDGGVVANLTGLLTLEASAGYLTMDYDDGSLSSTEGVAAGLRATWNITRLTTITAVIDRQVEATTVDGASSRFDTLGELRVDHELMRDLIVSANAAYLNSDFDGTSREDDRYNLGVAADYYVTQGVKLSASAGRDERDSNAPGADFTRDV
ncbi:MAG TPA: outer membrane beta-barrel protein, partial [Thalassobaculum sp.]